MIDVSLVDAKNLVNSMVDDYTSGVYQPATKKNLSTPYTQKHPFFPWFTWVTNEIFGTRMVVLHMNEPE